MGVDGICSQDRGERGGSIIRNQGETRGLKNGKADVAISHLRDLKQWHP